MLGCQGRELNPLPLPSVVRYRCATLADTVFAVALTRAPAATRCASLLVRPLMPRVGSAAPARHSRVIQSCAGLVPGHVNALSLSACQSGLRPYRIHLPAVRVVWCAWWSYPA